MFVTVDDAELIGLVVAVLRLALATPLVPVKLKVPVPPADCFLMTTLLSGKLSASSMPSPVAPLLVSAHVMLNETDVIPVPVIWTEPHAVPAGATVHSAPVATLLVTRLNEVPVKLNCELLFDSSAKPTVPPVETELPSVHTVVESFVPFVPPNRSMWSTGLSTGLLKVNVKVSVVPNGAGLMKSDGPPLTAAP